MKKLVVLFILCITTIATKAQSGDAKGEWSGQLNVFGQKLTLVFHLNDGNCTLEIGAHRNRYQSFSFVNQCQLRRCK